MAVTIIEVALIVSMMIAGRVDTTGLARDTVFSAVMIVCTGVVGLCRVAFRFGRFWPERLRWKSNCPVAYDRELELSKTEPIESWHLTL